MRMLINSRVYFNYLRNKGKLWRFPLVKQRNQKKMLVDMIRGQKIKKTNKNSFLNEQNSQRLKEKYYQLNTKKTESILNLNQKIRDRQLNDWNMSSKSLTIKRLQ